VYWRGGVFISIKNCIDCWELWAEEDFEMIATEVKFRDTKFTWEIVGIYRAPHEDIRVLQNWQSKLDMQEIV